MLRSIRSTSRAWLLLLAFALLAVPATAEVFHVTLTNGSTVDSSVQPQQASWDPNMVMLMTEVGNWVGFQKDEITDIKVVDPTAGFGVRISNTAIALGRFSNDLPDPTKGGSGQDDLNSRYLSLATKALELQERQQNYSVQQFVSPGQTQGIPASFAGYGNGGLVPGATGQIPSQPITGGSQPVPVVQPPGEK
jgi:hypothetical protein